MGKVVEKMAAQQFQRALDEADCLDPFKSGFRLGYGLETSLVTPLDDLCHVWDGGWASIFALLDGFQYHPPLSGFPYIDHGYSS